MHSRRRFICTSIAIIFSMLTACSSSPKQNAAVSTSEPKYYGPVNEVTINFSDEAQTKLETIDSFDMIDFNQTVINALDVKDLFSASSDKSLEILINSVSTEPTTSIVFSDINSETAHIKGNLIIKNKVQQIIGQHNISTDYAQGEFKDSQDEFRPDWLYTQFANQTTQTLTGKVNKSSAIATKLTNNNQAVSDVKEDSSDTFKQVLAVIISLAAFAAGFSAGL